MKCVAIDDEKNALEVISMYCNKIPEIELIAQFTDPIEASRYVEQHHVDLLFVDINMSGLNGFELLETLSKKPKIIFTTAYSEYAVQSYQVNALDYLVKPIPFGRFVKAINKAIETTKPTSEPLAQPSNEEFISIKSGTAIHRVKISDIIFLKAEGNYTKYVTIKENILALSTFKESITKLEGFLLQTHRSYAVTPKQVEKVEQHQLHAAGHKIPISSSYRKATIEYFE